MDYVDFGIDPETDPHRHNPDPHWRIYYARPHATAPTGGPTLIQVQDFDYPDYEAARFMTAEAYSSEEEGGLALRAQIFLMRLQRNRSPEERLARAVESIDTIVTTLNRALDGEDDRQYAAEQTLKQLRVLQAKLIR